MGIAVQNVVNKRLSKHNYATCSLQDSDVNMFSGNNPENKGCKQLQQIHTSSQIVETFQCIRMYKYTLIDLSGTCIFTVNICSIKGKVDGYASATSIRARKLIESACNRICENGKIMHLDALLEKLASDASILTSKLRIEFWSSLQKKKVRKQRTSSRTT